MRKRIADPVARPSGPLAALVQVRAKKPPSPGRGDNPSLEINCDAPSFMGKEIDTGRGVCTPFRLPVASPIGEAPAMDSPNDFIDRSSPVLLGRLKRLVG